MNIGEAEREFVVPEPESVPVIQPVEKPVEVPERVPA